MEIKLQLQKVENFFIDRMIALDLASHYHTILIVHFQNAQQLEKDHNNDVIIFSTVDTH
jgi:hypothetical protein